MKDIYNEYNNADLELDSEISDVNSILNKMEEIKFFLVKLRKTYKGYKALNKNILKERLKDPSNNFYFNSNIKGTKFNGSLKRRIQVFEEDLSIFRNNL